MLSPTDHRLDTEPASVSGARGGRAGLWERAACPGVKPEASFLVTQVLFSSPFRGRRWDGGIPTLI